MPDFSRWQQHLRTLLETPWVPKAIGGVLVLIAALVWFNPFGPVTHVGGSAIVVFDPVKFANAQRATASLLLKSPTADMSFALTQVAQQAEAVIAEEAHGAIVLVRQAVVLPDQYPDITLAVIRRFGLPENVPTVSTAPNAAAQELLEITPTNAAYSAAQADEQVRMDALQQQRMREVGRQNQTAQERTVP